MSTSSRGTRALPGQLLDEVTQAGFYPELVTATIVGALGSQPVVTHLVHHEATFTGHEVQRHMTVLVLTERQLIICHTDDTDQGNPDRALTSSEVVALRSISSVVMTRSVANPERAHHDLVETWLTVVWGAASRLDLGPAACEDPDCVADHGFTGMAVPNDLTVRMSPAGDGPGITEKLLEFGSLLQERVG